MKKYYAAIVSIALMFLVGCGGGGGSASSSGSNPKVCTYADLESAFPAFEDGGEVYKASFEKTYDGELASSSYDDLINKGFVVDTIDGGLRKENVIPNVTAYIIGSGPISAWMYASEYDVVFGDAEFDSVFGGIQNVVSVCKSGRDYKESINSKYATYESALEDAGFTLSTELYRVYWKKSGNFYYMSYKDGDHHIYFEAVNYAPCFTDGTC